MSRVLVEGEADQQHVLVMFLAKLVCHQETGPCQTCRDCVREDFLERLWPAMREAFHQAATHRDPCAGFGSLMISTATLAPYPDRPEEPEPKEPWQS